jgi:hypothetical protein
MLQSTDTNATGITLMILSTELRNYRWKENDRQISRLPMPLTQLLWCIWAEGEKQQQIVHTFSNNFSKPLLELRKLQEKYNENLSCILAAKKEKRQTDRQTEKNT